MKKLFQTLCDNDDSEEGIKHLELNANNATVKVAAEFNDKTGKDSYVKVATEIRHQVQQLELPECPSFNPSNIFRLLTSLSRNLLGVRSYIS